MFYYKNVNLYVDLGLKVTRIYRVLQFSQKAWLKEYIDFNTEKRKHAANDFERDFFKLLNNSTFGKTMENVRGRRNFELVCNEQKLMKRVAKPQMEAFTIINENVVLIERLRRVVLLNKPMYAGFCILDLSKVLMYDYHYNVIVKRYAARLLFTDTDSLTYHVRCDDFYADMLIDKHLYDTSNYDPLHILFSKDNAKTLGKFKDECGGQSPLEFVGLRSKMYSLLIDRKMPSKRTAKGVKRNYVVKTVRHEMYLNTLHTRECTRANFVNFKSAAHNVETVNVSRICLSAYDDKRYVNDSDGISTLAYGHKSLRT